MCVAGFMLLCCAGLAAVEVLLLGCAAARALPDTADAGSENEKQLQGDWTEPWGLGKEVCGSAKPRQGYVATTPAAVPHQGAAGTAPTFWHRISRSLAS